MLNNKRIFFIFIIAVLSLFCGCNKRNEKCTQKINEQESSISNNIMENDLKSEENSWVLVKGKHVDLENEQFSKEYEQERETIGGTEQHLENWKNKLEETKDEIRFIYVGDMSDKEYNISSKHIKNILDFLYDAKLDIFTELGNPATGGNTAIIALDKDDNILWHIAYDDYWFVVLTEDKEIVFNGEHTNKESIYSIDINKFTNITHIKGLCYVDEEEIYIIGLNKDADGSENSNSEIILARYDTADEAIEVVDTWKGKPEQTIQSSKSTNGETTLFTGEMIYRISAENQVLEKYKLPKFQQREPCINFSSNSMVYVHEDNLNLYLYDFETKEDKLLYECDKVTDPNSFICNPVISENGKYVFFQVCSYEAMSIKNMYILNFETGEMSEINFQDIISGETYNIWLENKPTLVSYVEETGTMKLLVFNIDGILQDSITSERLIEEIKWQDVRNNQIPFLTSKSSYTSNVIGAINPKTLEINIINETKGYILEYDISPFGNEVAWVEDGYLYLKNIEK